MVATGRRPTQVLTILLSIGILLQLVQIYRTSHVGTVADNNNNPTTSGVGMTMLESPRNLLRSSSSSSSSSLSSSAATTTAKNTGDSITVHSSTIHEQMQAQLLQQQLQYQRLKEEFDEQNQYLNHLLARVPFQEDSTILMNKQQQQNQPIEYYYQEKPTFAQAQKDFNMILYGNENGPPEEKEMVVHDNYDDSNNIQNDTYTEAPFLASEYNYSLPAKRNQDTLPTEPKISTVSEPSFNLVAVIVLSGRTNFERRQTIRETWARGHSNVYFVIGGSRPSSSVGDEQNNNNNNDNDSQENRTAVTSKLFQEQERYRDMLDTIHPDTYRSLPYKLDYAITWIGKHERMKHVQWILKVDDDVVVRLNALVYHVLRKYDASVPTVIGRIEPASTPHRTGKWAEDPKMDLSTYPPWAYGSTGYAVSRAVVDYVASQTSLYYYQGEDVSLGLWLYESDLDVAWIDFPGFCLHQAWYNHQHSVVIGHSLDIETMRTLYDKWKDPIPSTVQIRHANHTKERGFIYYHQVGRLSDDMYENGMLEETLLNDDAAAVAAAAR